MGVNVVADACCLSRVEGEGDIGVKEDIGGEGWLGESVDEGGFEVGNYEFLDWRLVGFGVFGVGVL